RAARTPKSPQPGHQSGSTLPFVSAIVSGRGLSTMDAICVSSSDHDFVLGNRKVRVPGELFFHRFDDVMRHEWFTVIFAYVAVGYKTGFAAQVARKLSTVIVLDDDRVVSVFQECKDGFTVKWYEPPNLKLIGGDALLAEELAGFLDDSPG